MPHGRVIATDHFSIVAVNTYSIILKPEYRERGRGKSAQAKGTAAGAQEAFSADGDNQFKKRVRTPSGGAASWFLFILKVQSTSQSSVHQE